MCQLFVNADPSLWESRLRSVRMHGFSTSVRLEKIYWMLLEEIARRDGLSVAEILARLYEELLDVHGAVENFASFLRVCCARYLMLQLAGDMPTDLRQPIAGLDAKSILAREERRLAGKDGAGVAQRNIKARAPARCFSGIHALLRNVRRGSLAGGGLSSAI